MHDGSMKEIKEMPDSFGRSRDQAHPLESRITQALEQAPPVTAPEGFAARVMAGLPEHAAQSVPPLRRSYFGFAAVAASLVVLLAAMLWLAPRATGHALYWMGFEWILCAQFCVAAVWLGLRGSRLE
jgi:hypothetical protein